MLTQEELQHVRFFEFDRAVQRRLGMSALSQDQGRGIGTICKQPANPVEGPWPHPSVATGCTLHFGRERVVKAKAKLALAQFAERCSPGLGLSWTDARCGGN